MSEVESQSSSLLQKKILVGNKEFSWKPKKSRQKIDWKQRTWLGASLILDSEIPRQYVQTKK